MELKRVIAADMRTAKEQAWARFGKDVLILSNERVNGRVELIVASDDQPHDDDALTKAEAPVQLPRPGNDKTAFSSELSRAAALMRNAAGDTRQSGDTARTTLRPADPLDDDDPSRAQALVDMIRTELQQMRSELHSAKALFSAKNATTSSGAIENLVRAMEEVDIPFALRLILAEEVRRYESIPQARDRIRLLLSQNIKAVAATVPSTGVHVIAGPSGAGKSHMVSRIAGMQGAGLSPDDIAIISYNDQRPGAWAQIQLIGSNAGVDVYKARNASTLVELLAHMTDRKLTIIDTPGNKCLEHVANIRSHVANAGFHLSIPADAPVSLCRAMIDNRDTPWHSLMVTKADECLGAWPLLSYLTQKQLRISFIGDIAINEDSALLDRATTILVERSLRQLISMSDEPAVEDGAGTEKLSSGHTL